jgi:hypothetical protein
MAFLVIAAIRSFSLPEQSPRAASTMVSAGSLETMASAVAAI